MLAGLLAVCGMMLHKENAGFAVLTIVFAMQAFKCYCGLTMV
jgi:hypothetical protein